MTALNELPTTVTSADEDLLLVQQGGGDRQISKGDLLTTTTSTGSQTVAGALDDRVVRVGSVAGLRALTGVTDVEVSVAGYYAPGDGGGGPLRVWKTGAPGTYTDNGGSVIVPTGGDGSGAWVWEHSGFINAKWFGVKGDAVTDDADRFEAAALASVTSLGAAVSVEGCNTIRLAREIQIPSRSFHLIGDGRLHVYPWEEATGFVDADKLSTFLIDHSDRNAFKMSQNGSARGLYFENVNIIKKSGATCVAAFGFDTFGAVSGGKDYGYDTTFKRCGIFDFTSAFDMYASSASSEPTMAAILIEDCAINRNGWIARNLNSTAWNGFTFIDNKAGQQTTGGVSISAHKFEEHGNYWEGMPNPIKLTGGYRGFVSFGSYFEANSGSALIDLTSHRGPTDIGPHTILSNSTDVPVKLQNCALVQSQIPYVGNAVYKSVMPQFGDDSAVTTIIGNVDPATYPMSSINEPSVNVLTKPNGFLTFDTNLASSAALVRASNPFNGKAIPLESYITASTGATTEALAITGSSGEYVSVTVLMKHVPDGLGNPNPYISLNVNGTSAAGSKDFAFGEAGLWFREGDWMTLHAVIKLGVAMTSLNVTLFPFGVSPTAGRVAHILPAHAYSTVDLRNCKPYLDEFTLSRYVAAPVSGSWERGDVLYDISPAAAGTIGWVCVASGSPGTWKTFGAITA